MFFRGIEVTPTLPQGVATSRGASRPRAPALPSAILLRPVATVVTHADFLQCILFAALSAMSRLLHDVTEAFFHAAALGASSPRMPISEFAIDRVSSAAVSVAFLDHLERVIASNAAIHWHEEDFAIPKLLTATARGRTIRPRGPLADFTVLWLLYTTAQWQLPVRSRITWRSLLPRAKAPFAVASTIPVHLTRTALYAFAACGALAPITPITEQAVH